VTDVRSRIPQTWFREIGVPGPLGTTKEQTMPVRDLRPTFLSDLSRAHSGARAALEILEQSAGAVADKRVRALLNRQAGQARARIRDLGQIFALMAAEPQDLGCPATAGIRWELERFRLLNPTPEVLTATVLFAGLKIQHDGIAAVGLLVDQAVRLGRAEVARILSVVAGRERETMATIDRLIHQVLREMADDPVAEAGSGAVQPVGADHGGHRAGRAAG
jgi:ferritin-like metal-binding protein YciE